MNYNNKQLIGAMIVAGWDEAEGGQVTDAAHRPVNFDTFCRTLVTTPSLAVSSLAHWLVLCAAPDALCGGSCQERILP